MQHHASRQDHQETHRASSQAKQSVSANRNPGVYAGFKIGKKKHLLYCVTVNCHGDNLRKKREKKTSISHLLLVNDVLACQSYHYPSLAQIVI